MRFLDLFAIVRRQVCCSAVFSLLLQGNIEFPRAVTRLPLGRPVVGLPPFSLWTGGFCSISSADDDPVPRVSLFRAGCTTGGRQVYQGLTRDGLLLLLLYVFSNI